MTGMNEFLAYVWQKKLDAKAHGMNLDLIVLHRDFHDTLMRAVSTMKVASDAFELRDHPTNKDRKDTYLHGVKVLWAGHRLPAKQAWYLYSNPRMKAKL